MGLTVELKERILIENDVLEAACKIDGRRFLNTRRCELEYVIESVLRGKKRKKTIRFPWGKLEKDQILMKRKFQECDLYKIRFVSLKWRDLTGLYTVKKELFMEEEVLVMPKRFPLEAMNDKLQKIRLEEEGFEYDGIRMYHPGDRLSRIHWKLFAGKGELYVRKSEDETADPTAIALDISDLKKKQYSDYFSVFYSVSGFLLDEGIPQKIFFGESCYFLKSFEQYEELFTKIFRENLKQPIAESEQDMIKITLGSRGQNVEDYVYDMEL